MTDVPDLNQELFAEKLLPYLPATADEIMRHIGKDRELREAYETCNVGLHLLLHLMREKVFGSYCITKEHGSKVWRSWGQVPDVFDIDDEDLATFTSDDLRLLVRSFYLRGYVTAMEDLEPGCGKVRSQAVNDWVGKSLVPFQQHLEFRLPKFPEEI